MGKALQTVPENYHNILKIGDVEPTLFTVLAQFNNTTQ